VRSERFKTLLSILLIVSLMVPAITINIVATLAGGAEKNVEISLSGLPPNLPYAHIVLIVIDGVRPDVLLAANTPNFDALASEGSYTWNAWTVWPSVTIAAVPSIYTGATPEVHGVTDWHGDIHAETLTEVFNEAGLTSAIVGNDAILGGYAATYCTGYYSTPDPAEHFMNIAIDWFINYRPFFLTLYNPMPDRMAHTYGHESAEYREAIENADYHIGRLIQVLKDLGVYDNTLIVITTDHGMTGKSHSGGYESDMRIFSIWRGPKVKKGYEMANDVYVPPMRGYANVRIHAVEDDSWSENTITWHNLPALGEVIADNVLVDALGWYSWDITGFVSQQLAGDGVVSIAMVDVDENLSSDHSVGFEAKEWWNVAVHPYLEIRYQPQGGHDSTIRLEPVEDSFVAQDRPTSNFGAWTCLYVGRYRGGAERAFLKFDLSAIPSGSSIIEARYHNYCWGTSPVGWEGTYVAHRIIDIAPTISALAGFRAPENSEGSVIYQIFEGLAPRAPIYIEGNDNFTAANGVVGGSGTENDPYIIENWDISAENAHGIWIRNTTAHFVIRNCYVHDGKYNRNRGVLFDNVKNGKVVNVTSERNLAGIFLAHSGNTLIENCVIENNGGEGIRFNYSNNNRVINSIISHSENVNLHLYWSDNNIIDGCIISSTYGGVALERSSNNSIVNSVVRDHGDVGIFSWLSDKNRIYHNNFINNTTQALDYGVNYWDNGYPSGGNYWSDYTGEDNYWGENQNILGSDGIGDTPYYIPGDNNRDRYPLMGPWPPTRGVEVSISPFYQSGPPGTTLIYTVTVKNTGNIVDNFLLWTTDAYGWDLELDNAWLVIPPSENRTTTLRVTIPSDAVPCTEDNIDVVAISQSDSSVNNLGWCLGHALEVGIPIPAIIDIDPDTLNLRSKGRWITAYIELPSGYSVENIDVSTVRLIVGENEVPAEPWPTGIGDYDNDGIPDLMVKFSRSAVQALLSVGEYEMKVVGEVAGLPFEGSDVITVIDFG
jgi:parallel beta-helix repeat protein